MKRINQIGLLAFALGATAAAQAPVPPVPPVPPARSVPAAPAKPAKPPRPAAPVKASSYLGVDLRNVTHDNMAALKLNEARGAEITMVDRDAPAGKAGLKERDVILSFNGRNIQSGDELRSLIRQTPPGQTVELGISRGGQPMTIKAQLADRRNFLASTHVAPQVHVRIPRIEIPAIAVYPRRNGIVVENLTPQLGEVFGVQNGEGVLIRSVAKDSAGEKAGLRAGDVIVRVSGEAVASASDWNRLMREQKPGLVPLGIIREKRQQTVSLTLPERNPDQSYTLPEVEDFGSLQDYGPNMEELQRLGPQIQQSMREAQEKLQRELERNQREFERSQREFERSQREAERARERAQRDAERAREQAQRQQEQAQERAQREQERAQREAERAQEQAERERERAQREQGKTPPPPTTQAPETPAKPPAPPQ